MKIAHVALDFPLQDAFDFRVPEGFAPVPGSLVVVPFGRGKKVGMVVGLAGHSEVPGDRLRDLEKVVEDVPPMAPADLDLLRFCASYYHRALGEVIATSLPPRIRQVSRRKLGVRPRFPPKPLGSTGNGVLTPDFRVLTPAQEEAVMAVADGLGKFHPVLLHGVTGSGKTEVYLQVVAEVLAQGRQALFLVPEIGLTPQLEATVRSRFPDMALVSAHSHLSEGERAAAWLDAQSGRARIVLGTRLAVLMPFQDLGVIVIDEEHDPSYKQQEGLRYSARDVAVRRAQMLEIPIVLGSATPSLESFANARQGRYTLANLPVRAMEGASMPRIATIDTRADKPVDGLTHALATAIAARLARGEQSLVFVNRRGFSPVLYCRDCTWHSGCPRCAANLVLHLRSKELRCHHCGHRERIPQRCPGCGGMDLAPVGHGTQRVEETLKARFPAARIARIDRDSTARKGALGEMLDAVRAGDIDILVGTQMLSKGHDYPALTLVGVLDSDSGLFSADFRAGERLFSQLVQVAGRAGRASQPGEVLIQTDFPAHPLYASVATHDHQGFAEEALAERQAAGFPPFTFLALLRAESKQAGEALAFLKAAAEAARGISDRVEVFDPVPAPLEKKAGFERAQLLVRAKTRAALQPFLGAWKGALDARGERRVRWSIDIDPQEV